MVSPAMRWVVFTAGIGLASCGEGRDDARDPDTLTRDDAWFRDRTADSGVDFERLTGGSGQKFLPEINGGCVALLDHDGDGRLDLFFGQAASLPGTDPGGDDDSDRLYRNLGELKFEDVTEQANAHEPGYTFHAAAPDLDGDGDPELYLCNLAHNVILWNEGGRFEDATDRVGGGVEAYSTSSSFGDFDRDGDLDAYVVNYVVGALEHEGCFFNHQGVRHRSYCSPKEFPGADDVLLRNDDGHLVDATRAAGVAGRGGSGLASLACDYDLDGDLDLFIANDGRENFLWNNQLAAGASGTVGFVDAAESAGVDVAASGRSEASMGCDFADVDGDGDFDLLIANLAMETNTLYRNEGRGLFRDLSNPSGLGRPSLRYVGFGCEFFDVDHDGDPDAMISNGHILDNAPLVEPSQTFRQPPQLYLNDGAGHYTERSADFGPYFTGRWVGRGLATGDLDDDGDLDVVVVHNRGAPALLENTRGSQRSWIAFRLVGRGANRDAIGARVVVEAGGRTQVEELRGTSSYAAFQDLRVHFGLGEAERVERVIVHWPEGGQSELQDLAARQCHTISME